MTPWRDCAPCHSQPDGARLPLTRHPAYGTSPPTRANSVLLAHRLPNSARHGRTAAIIVPVWLPRAALISIYWDLARPVRLPLLIIHGVNDTDVSLRWIRAKSHSRNSSWNYSAMSPINSFTIA